MFIHFWYFRTVGLKPTKMAEVEEYRAEERGSLYSLDYRIYIRMFFFKILLYKFSGHIIIIMQLQIIFFKLRGIIIICHYYSFD